MFTRSKRSILATARWMLAIWVAFAVSSAIAPCQEALAVPPQGAETMAYAATKAPRNAHHGERIAGKTVSTLSGFLHCVETVSPRLSKIATVSAPASSDFSPTALTGYSPLFISSSVPRLFTALLDARPQVFLKTSRLLI